MRGATGGARSVACRALDAFTFFGLEPTPDPTRWKMPITTGLVSGRGTLFGGAGLGACIEIAEHTTGRPVIWASAQYLSFARPGDVLELDVQELVRGHQTSQVRILARVGDDEILCVLASLGERPVVVEGQWEQPPAVPPPAECPPREIDTRHGGTMMSRLAMRLADAPWTPANPVASCAGNSAVWVLLPDGLECSPAALALVGDLVPFGIRQATGRPAGGSSLDNTLRVAHPAATEWVLADVRVHSLARGYGHGLVHLWAEDGTLLGTASQSSIVREWKADSPPSQEVAG